MELFDKNQLIRIGKYLKRKKETIAVAESVTAGLLQYAFSNIPDATDFYQGGLTAYNVAQKFKHLQVEPIHAMAVNCVSPSVAEQMALQVCRIFGAHWGIGITGYATPVPESDNKQFAYFAITYKEKILLKGMLRSNDKNPPEAQLHYTQAVLQKLATVLK
ncbi:MULTISPECIES: CinA family protein [Niastella]|uniref:CinA family protein n=1 Tax=Niastella soli TaxID=2821487 RepID=A0ABS3Z2F2_9BACT|nr:CinA family protein [Niastella soli]MBO9204351.1 CinA family protein [Niastella soli]